MLNLKNNKNFSENIWIEEVSQTITDPKKLLSLLSLHKDIELQKGISANTLFPLRIPLSFIKKIKIGDPNDPVFRQIMPTKFEFNKIKNFSKDPLKEHNNTMNGLLHKYKNRVLLIIKIVCAIHCRYCFRRFFPYKKHINTKYHWKIVFNYIKQHKELNEVIFSGGDPLMATDHELDLLISELENIPHIKTLRIHTRLPIVIPARITKKLCYRFKISRLNIIMVTHINHVNEIDDKFSHAVKHLKQVNVTLLNQSVLLQGINNNSSTLMKLSYKLFDIGIIPYYLHLLDKIQGGAHFMVTTKEARIIMKELLLNMSGYLIPKLMKEVNGKGSKIPVNLQL